ncbi:MAG: peptide deformylase [Deltaproteobacteria bacterium]|nr:MAG: peptide deformylase [Deltaproteobacteria bacterium]
MAILEIIEAPHPVLAAKARPVRDDEFGDALAAHMQDMAETMYAAPGVGLAAPQVGDSRRVIVADPGNDPDEADDERQLYLMVNPVIIERSREMIEGEEQCLSVPEMTVRVRRHRRIVVRWRDPYGAPREEAFEDWAATVLQHELDHLDGTTLYDRASRLKRSRYVKRRKKLVREPLHAR